MKVVINRCYGGFGLSDAAIKRYGELKNLNIIKGTIPESIDGAGFHSSLTAHFVDEVKEGHYFDDHRIHRHDPALVQVVEELGDAASGTYAELSILEIPDGTPYIIEEYDGIEWLTDSRYRWPAVSPDYVPEVSND